MDLNGGYDEQDLIDGYREEARQNVGGKSVRVVYVSRANEFDFRAAA